MNTLHIHDERTGVLNVLKKEAIQSISSVAKQEGLFDVSVKTATDTITIPMDGASLQSFVRWYDDENNLQITIPAPTEVAPVVEESKEDSTTTQKEEVAVEA